MNWGDFRTLFKGVAWKRLTPHEVDASVSNGHEFQGVSTLRNLLGTETIERLTTTYMLLRDEQDDIETIHSWSSWYDSRRNQRHRSPEWRLYYPSEAGQIQAQMHDGDLMVLAPTRKGTLFILMAEKGSSREQELLRLFRIEESGTPQLSAVPFDESLSIDYVSASILDELGLVEDLEPAGSDSINVTSLVEELVGEYPESLPPGATVAALVRSRVTQIDAIADPDGALMRWIEVEAAVYRAWEDKKIERRLKEGFITAKGIHDIEGFRKFSMSLRQSRVSRAGGALQFHFRALLDARRVPYAMEPRVDGGELPDFLFPGLREYENPNYPADGLRMLAAKFTAKDRWRQVLNEAERIRIKHLLTLETGITPRQMSLMNRAQLLLVLPIPVLEKYPEIQRKGALSLASFINEVAHLPDLERPPSRSR
jgi:hypothetical protein